MLAEKDARDREMKKEAEENKENDASARPKRYIKPAPWEEEEEEEDDDDVDEGNQLGGGHV